MDFVFINIFLGKKLLGEEDYHYDHVVYFD